MKTDLVQCVYSRPLTPEGNSLKKDAWFSQTLICILIQLKRLNRFSDPTREEYREVDAYIPEAKDLGVLRFFI
jgi:hypothetical protein